METTTAKAKEIRPFVEKLITKAKVDNLASRRLVNVKIGNLTATKKLFEVLAPKYKARNGGYTRITRLPNRTLDNSPMSVIEFV
jgi:large subunit ribosomal protein L17